MAGGLFSLLDDVAAFAKMAASSVDDVAVAGARASAKTAGVVVDDAAVTPAYVRGLAAERELPIIARIAKASLRNKLLFILPVALLLSAVAPIAIEVLLLAGGTYLCYEGAHKIHHRLTHRGHAAKAAVVNLDVDSEEKVVADATRTDLILSAEIMIIAMKDVIDEGFAARAAILVFVAVLITAVVYGVVAAIVKMDDIGLRLATSEQAGTAKLGRGLVAAMPKLLAALAVIGTAAMLWVGGHIWLASTHELGWHTPYDVVSDLEHWAEGAGSVAAWSVDTLASAAVGAVIGAVALVVTSWIRSVRTPTEHEDLVSESSSSS